MTPRPFLILTLRRTGGTSLMAFLSQISPFPSMEHEPFNKNRVWGPVAEGFRDTGEIAPVRAAIAEAVRDQRNLKHCFEFLPSAITAALIEACHAAGYRIFLLTRRNEVGRIASLFLARATGAWGSAQAGEIYPRILAGEIEAQAVDPKAMQNQMARDMRATCQVQALLRHRRIPYDWQIFEELYQGETPIELQALAIARDLGIAVAEDDPRLQTFAQKGGQGSSQIAAHVKGLAAGRRLLARHWME